MQQELKNYLLRLELTDSEIESILNMAPMFEVITLKEFIEDMMVLIKYGYPEEDISALLLINPNIFVLTKTNLDNQLKEIKQKFGDIERALKENPFLI